MTDQTTDPTTLDQQTADLVENLRVLTDEIADRNERADEIKAQLRERLQPDQKYSYAGRRVLQLGKAGESFDAKRAAQVIPRELHASVSRPRLDPDLCRRILPPDLYAQCVNPRSAPVKPI